MGGLKGLSGDGFEKKLFSPKQVLVVRNPRLGSLKLVKLK
tara:strand:- start:110678 stop:110797 length:120 start_codon:yes stop_codon:yes gene_type:complete